MNDMLSLSYKRSTNRNDFKEGLSQFDTIKGDPNNHVGPAKSG